MSDEWLTREERFKALGFRTELVYNIPFDDNLVYQYQKRFLGEIPIFSGKNESIQNFLNRFNNLPGLTEAMYNQLVVAYLENWIFGDVRSMTTEEFLSILQLQFHKPVDTLTIFRKLRTYVGHGKEITEQFMDIFNILKEVRYSRISALEDDLGYEKMLELIPAEIRAVFGVVTSGMELFQQ